MKTENRLNILTEFYSAPIDALFPQKTLCAILDCSEASAERNRWAGTGVPFIKIGRMVRYQKKDILDYLEKRQLCRSTTQEHA